MLEGNEIETQVGSGGKAIVDVNDKGIVRAEFNYAEGSVKGGAFVEADIIDMLKQLAAKSSNSIDDKLVAMIASALGR